MDSGRTDDKSSALVTQATGMVWYTLENFSEIKAMMVDGHLLPATYSEWRIKAEQGERQLRRQGHRVFRAHLEPDAFRQFCASRGLNLDAKGRTEFGSWFAYEQMQRKS